MKITVSQDAKLGPNTINFSAFTTFDIKDTAFTFLPAAQSTIQIQPEILFPYSSADSMLEVNVQAWSEKIIEWLNKWQFPITFVSGIIIGNVVPWLFKRIKNKIRVK
jgi:hypothetical protein